MSTESSRSVLEKANPPREERNDAQEVKGEGKLTERLSSLDAFRGFTMLWIIGGSHLMLRLQHVGSNPVIGALADQMHHTPWQGLRYYDCIWPCFVLIVGMSVALSVAKRLHTQSYREITLHALKRAIALFLLSSLIESINQRSVYLIDVDGALQQIGVVYFVCFLLVRKSPGVLVTVSALILVAQGLVEAFVGTPGIPAGSFQFKHNIVYAIDMALLGHAQPQGFGTLLPSLPPVSIAILGLLFGKFLISGRSIERKVLVIGGAGLFCLAAGYTLSMWIPVVMKMATASWGLLAAGWASLLFMLFFWFIDVRGYKTWSIPLQVIGINALFIYAFSLLIDLDQPMSLFSKALVGASSGLELLLRSVLVFGVEWLMLFWMYRRQIFIRP
jgi:predicted acyltransferase